MVNTYPSHIRIEKGAHLTHYGGSSIYEGLGCSKVLIRLMPDTLSDVGNVKVATFVVGGASVRMFSQDSWDRYYTLLGAVTLPSVVFFARKYSLCRLARCVSQSHMDV